MAFYQKYRPKTFSELIGEDHIKKTLIEAVKSDRLSHAYLLCGPRGTGKTSTARLLAKAFNCETILADQKAGRKTSGEPCNECQTCIDISLGRAVDIIEIDAASHTKVDEIREVIDQANFVPTRTKKKIYIIDEVHMLSNSSFNALLKTLEEPPAHVAFILATTEVHKLPQTILSRTQRFDFRRITKDDIVKNLKDIAKKEKIEVDDQALEIIALSAEGGHRDAIGLLEQVASVSNHIGEDEVLNILGMAKSEEIFKFIGAIFNKIPEEGLKIAHRLFSQGTSMSQFNKGVIEALRKILLLSVSGQVLFEDTKENVESVGALSKETDEEKLIKIIEIFIKTGQLLKDVSYPILPIEMAIVESCAFNQNHGAGIMNHEKATDQDRQTVNKSQISTAVISTPRGDLSRVEKSLESADNSENGDSGAKTKESVEIVTEHNDPSPATSYQLPAAETRSVSVFQMTDDLWQRVIEEAKKENTTLAALLRDAKPLEVNGNRVKLGVKFPFHKNKISEPKNCAFLEKIFSEITGTKCILSCEISSLKPKKTEKNEDLIKATEEVFG